MSIMPHATAAGPRWLLLVHQLPPRPSNTRVHIWRRLQQVGAVALRNSLYVLPHTPEAREDFDWIRVEIASRGGQVSILTADAVDGYTDDEMEATFRAARSTDYEALIRDADALTNRLTHTRRKVARAAAQRNVAKITERFRALTATDFFRSPRASEARTAVERLESILRKAPPASGSSEQLHSRFFRRRTWVTRPRPGIDRMASAWLIRRFVAPDAKFTFGSVPVTDGQIPFDMPDVEFGHHGTDCTYETLVRRFGITDPAAVRVGQIVHDLDLKESRYGLPDTATVGRLVEGFRDAGTSDQDILDSGMEMIEALYRSFISDSRGPTVPHRRPATTQRENVSAKPRRHVK
jgi:hypothetical protein